MKLSWSKYELSKSYDEYITPKRTVRGHLRKIGNFFESLSFNDLQELDSATKSAIKSMGINFRVYSDEGSEERTWPLDFIPRIIKKSEWSIVEKGLKQRTKALNYFIEDCYNEQSFLNSGVINKSLITKSKYFLKFCKGIKLPNKSWAHISGSDLIKDIKGDFHVLEDNLRVPSGVSYMLENRYVMKRVFPDLFSHYGVSKIDEYPTKLYECLQDASLSKLKRPEIVLLTPGIYNSAYYEHSYLAQQMGIDLVEGSDLIVKKNIVYKKTIEGLQKVDVIYRRIDDDYLDPEVGNPFSVIGVKGLIRAWKSKNVSIVNAPGCGIADDKAVYSYVPEMINFFLKEEPILPNIKTFILSNIEERDYVFENIKKMVTKPVAESGGYGISIGKNLNDKEILKLKKLLMKDPKNYVAQPLIDLSTSPTFRRDSLFPRHLDLRPFILSGKQTYVTVGGLTRVALKRGSTVVNSSQGGGSKDTWIVDA
jgi:uncharacterized circularly permuted ATP-grasp superfamily protein